MVCLRYGLVLVLASMILTAQAQGPQSPATPSNQATTVINLRWGARAGVNRYRLQLAQDPAFADIVFDRVISATEYRITDLPPGRYFWRVASLGAKRGDFSSAGVVDVRDDSKSVSSDPPKRESTLRSENKITTGAGWYAAVGNATNPVLAHLRSPGTQDIVTVTSDGRVIALDAMSGVALWTSRAIANGRGAALPPLTIKTRAGLDHIVVMSSRTASMFDGKSGRQIWRSDLPGFVARAAVLGSSVFMIDSSLQKVFVIDGATGKLSAQLPLPRRAIGAPAIYESQALRGVMISLDDGRLQVFDQAGKLVRSGDAGSPATTAPLWVKSLRGSLVLVGTRNGLTALSADDLRPLGRVALNDDTPAGALFGRDLNGDGVTEVIMFTSRGRVAVVKSDEGKVIWEADAKSADAVTFADLNADGELDLLMAGREGFAFALSGPNGSLIWKEDAGTGIAANHSSSGVSRAVVVAPSPRGVLLIGGDQFRGGVRAVEFPRVPSPRK